MKQQLQVNPRSRRIPRRRQRRSPGRQHQRWQRHPTRASTLLLLSTFIAAMVSGESAAWAKQDAEPKQAQLGPSMQEWRSLSHLYQRRPWILPRALRLCLPAPFRVPSAEIMKRPGRPPSPPKLLQQAVPEQWNRGRCRRHSVPEAPPLSGRTEGSDTPASASSSGRSRIHSWRAVTSGAIMTAITAPRRGRSSILKRSRLQAPACANWVWALCAALTTGAGCPSVWSRSQHAPLGDAMESFLYSLYYEHSATTLSTLADYATLATFLHQLLRDTPPAVYYKLSWRQTWTSLESTLHRYCSICTADT